MTHFALFITCLIATFAAVFPSAAWATVRKDSFSSTTALGPHLGIQAFQLSRKFMVDESPNDRFFIPESARDEVAPLKLVPLNLGWNLGYAFGRVKGVAFEDRAKAAGETYTDYSHTFLAGLNYTFLGRMDLAVDAVYSKTPEENAKQGAIFAHFECYFPLTDRRRVTETVPDSKRIAAEDELRPRTDEPVVYPNIRVGVDFGFQNHFKGGPETLETARSARAKTLFGGEELKLASYGLGAHMLYEGDPNHSANLSVMSYRYGGDLAEHFMNQDDVGPHNMRGGMHLAGLAGYVAEIGTYPSLHVVESYAYDTTRGNAFEFIFSQTAFAYSSPMGLGFSPVWYKALSEKWNMGIGAEIMIGGGTYLVGSLQLSRFF